MENTSLLAWTTTPWTLPSNLALCVNAHEDYATAACAARARTSSWPRPWWRRSLRARKLTILEDHARAKSLRGMAYEPLYRFVGRSDKRAWYVVCDDYVTIDRRHGHRAHRPGLWRGRRPGVPEQRPALCAAGGHPGLAVTAGNPLGRRVCERGRSPDHRGPEGAGACSSRAVPFSP